MERKETKALAIIALIIGILALMLSWVPLINNFAAVLAGLGFIFALIALIINRKNKKTLSIVGFIISAIAFAIVLLTQSMYSKVANDVGKSVKTTVSSAQKKADDNFKWTKADYDGLVVGDITTGVGGTNYDGLEAKFGKSDSSTESTAGDYTTKDVSWNNMMGSSGYKSVSLTFVKQPDGTWLLSNKTQSGL